MDVVWFADALGQFEALMERVVDDHAPVVIVRDGAEAVVMISLADWPAMDATAYLLSSPRNAERLLEAIEETGHSPD